MFRRLSYVSRPSDMLPLAEISKIVSTCRSRNPAAAITGVLLFTGLDFAQVIEGPPGPASELWSRICADVRHRDIAVLLDEITADRWYSDWRVGFPSDSAVAARLASWREGKQALNMAGLMRLRQLFDSCEVI